MKIERHVSLLVVQVEGDDPQHVLGAYNDGLELAQRAVVAGTTIDRKRTMNGCTVRVRVELEDQ